MNNREIYIIYTPGRTGSHIILEALAGENKEVGGLLNAEPYWHTFSRGSFNLTNNVVIHTHSLDVIKELNLNPASLTLILSRRKDVFTQTMSHLVANITNEWSGKEYSNKSITPQIISKNVFLNIAREFNEWPKNISITDYKKVVSIYYEDIIEYGIQHIAKALDIEYIESSIGKIQRKSPYNYKDCILNWEDLYQEFLTHE